MKKTPEEPYNDKEIARMRDEVLRRMIHTPPQPLKTLPKKPRSKKPAN